MMVDFIGLFVLVVLLVLFGWLFLRSWRSKRAVLKWVGLVLTGLLTLVVALVLVMAVRGTLILNTNYSADHPAANIKVAGTPEQIARGKKLTQICGCHIDQQTGELSGNDFLAGGGPPAGTLYARNLTPGGELKNWTDGEIIRAFREGVHQNGRSLLIMPANIFHNLSDDDAQAIVAYLRTLKPVTPDAPPNNLNLVGALLAGMGGLQTVQPHISQPVAAPAEGPTADYGKYLVSIIGCRECHGENLAGGKVSGFGPPAGPNLTAFVPKWTQDQFMTTIRTGTDPTGHALNPDEMPWKEVSAFASDDDLKALYAYLHGLSTLPDNPKQ